MATDLTRIEALDERILNLCQHINAATYELLEMIREFDERVGFLKWGMANTVDWLAWRCENAARNLSLVRVRRIVVFESAIVDACGQPRQ